jgi:hypothetical protein
MTIAKVRYSAKAQTTGGWDGAFDIVAAWNAFTIRHTTILARFSAGRILLHLLAMLGDRCVRFHVAGIIRESSWLAAAAVLLLALIPSARAAEVPGYGFEAAAQEITQLFWLAETASACGWAQDGEATRFMDFSVRFLTAHLSYTHKQALLSLVSERRYQVELRRAALEGADQNCANSRWRLGWLSYKAAADEHETEY